MKRAHLEKIWKRTIFHLLLTVMVGIGILIYWALNSSQTGSDPTLLELAIVLAGLITFGIVFYLVSRSIKNAVWKLYGED